VKRTSVDTKRQYFGAEEKASNYNYFPDYDPAMGRYVGSDPIALDGGLTRGGRAAK
jgi:uncharacterized protein RhaS with RHS repeats